MTSGFGRGALAGAAGTTALNAVTYLDMALRGRPSSSTPQETVEASAQRAGFDIPGRKEERSNRLDGLGPLSGMFVGIAVGAIAGALHHALARHSRTPSVAVEVVLIAGAAMTMSDLPLKLLGVSDPASWSPKDWAADALPHLAYGVVTAAGIRAGTDG